MDKVIYKHSNKIPLALLAISSVISGYLSSASSSTSNELMTQEQVGTDLGAASSSSDPVVQAILGCDQQINVRMFSGEEFALSLPADATTWNLYRAAESKVNGGIGITLGGEQIPNYLYPTNTTPLTDLGITNNTTLTCVLMKHNSYQVHPDHTALDEALVSTAIHAMVIRRRLSQLHNTQEAIIHYPNSVEYSSDGENWYDWYTLGDGSRIDSNMKLRYVEDRRYPRRVPYVVATPAFVCDGDGPRYVQHLLLKHRHWLWYKVADLIKDLTANKNFGPFEECKSLLQGKLGRDRTWDLFYPSHVYRVNCTNELSKILSIHLSQNYSMIQLSAKDGQTLKTLLQNIGISNVKWYNDELSEEGFKVKRLDAKLKGQTTQWLYVSFNSNDYAIEQNPIKPSGGRICIRHIIGEPDGFCFVILNASS